MREVVEAIKENWDNDETFCCVGTENLNKILCQLRDEIIKIKIELANPADFQNKEK